MTIQIRKAAGFAGPLRRFGSFFRTVQWARRRVLSVLVALPAIAVALPQPGAIAAERIADQTALRCSFDEGLTWKRGQQGFAAGESNALSFDILGIDGDAQSATLDQAGSKARIRVVPALDARHFIEVTVAGYLNITTVYDSGEDSGWIAVHSRHLGVAGSPVLSQYRGFCRAIS